MDIENYGFGAIPSLPDIRDYALRKSKIAKRELPKYYVNPPVKIKSQGKQSTCVAYALSSLIEFHNFNETKQYTRFSTNFIYGCRFCSNYFGDGMYLRDGLNVIHKYGDVEYSLLPGNLPVSKACKKVKANFEKLQPYAYPNRISAYYRIKSINELKYSLYADGPVVATMYWFKKNKIDKYGTYYYDPSSPKSAHAVLIIGWNKTSLIVQNSWGSSFGKKGLFYIPISKWKSVFVEMYGVTDNITNIKKPAKIKKTFSPVINKILSWTKH